MSRNSVVSINGDRIAYQTARPDVVVSILTKFIEIPIHDKSNTEAHPGGQRGDAVIKEEEGLQIGNQKNNSSYKAHSENQVKDVVHVEGNTYNYKYRIEPPEDEESRYILLGKDRGVFNHSGNKKFREIICAHVQEYMNAHMKPFLAHRMFDEMEKVGYRFLRKDKAAKTGWIIISDDDARGKINHALRDKVREIKKATKRETPLRVSKSSNKAIQTHLLAMQKTQKQYLDL